MNNDIRIGNWNRFSDLIEEAYILDENITMANIEDEENGERGFEKFGDQLTEVLEDIASNLGDDKPGTLMVFEGKPPILALGEWKFLINEVEWDLNDWRAMFEELGI